MLLQEEIFDYRHQLFPRLPCRLGAGCSRTARRQHAYVIEAKQQHHRRQYQHHRHPCMPGSFVTGYLCGTLHSTEAYQQSTCQPDQSTGRYNLRYIVEGSLPTDILSLVLLAQFRHIDTIRSHIVCGSAESNHRQQRNAHRKKEWQLQRQSHQSKTCSGNHLRQYHEKLLRLKHFKERTPKELQRPGHHDERRPQSNLRVTDTQPLEHQHRNHVQHHERQSHGKIYGGDPRYRIMIFSAHPFCILSVSLQRFAAHSQLQRTAVHYILMREERSLQLMAVQHNALHILVVAAIVVGYHLE